MCSTTRIFSFVYFTDNYIDASIMHNVSFSNVNFGDNDIDASSLLYKAALLSAVYPQTEAEFVHSISYISPLTGISLLHFPLTGISSLHFYLN